MTNVSFKISSALKNVIGKELITDDFIAVFELVKNSFDARASEVEIIFKGLKSETPSIVIKDNGDGMDEADIKNKWLFVAYSAKKFNQDYRDKIKSDRIYAGSKGIGRFSCDRLGANLRLTTKKKHEDRIWHVLEVDWNRFEKDPEREFQTIHATLTDLDKPPFPRLQFGTILEISEFRSDDWNREKLLKLRRSLERLINPNQENDSDSFSIILKAPEEYQIDEEIRQKTPDESWNIVNGPIKNFLFEALELKTTQIQLEIDKDSSQLSTKLQDRGTLVYELIEKNPYKDILHDIQIYLFFLNRSAKYAFSRHMGLQPVQYGSVFLYKNGFRIYPFGNVGDDSLAIDRRHQQNIFRTLGTRDIIGRIEINGKNPDFQETSSRDGGIIENKASDALIELFIKYVLKRLENYVINFARFGDQGDFPELRDPNSNEQRKSTFDLIVKLTQSKDVIDVSYDPNVLKILIDSSAESAITLIKNLKRIAADQNNEKLIKVIARAERQVKALSKAKAEAETEAEKERARAEQAEREAKESYTKAQEAEEATRKAQEEAQESRETVQDVSTQNLFLKSILSKDLEHVIELHHSIDQEAITIEQFSSNLLTIVHDESKPLRREVFRAVLERINYTARKIETISRFATRANFRGDAEEITADLIGYIREYLLNIYSGFVLDPNQQKIDIRFSPSAGAEFKTQFAPINVSIVLDNLISNARKHKSKIIDVSVTDQKEDKLVISFRDNGKGILRKNIPLLFQMGFSTTDGSGLGLYHSRNIMLEMNGNITLNKEYHEGVEFILTFSKQGG
jgi:signal transduction histidine kinase